MVAIAPDSTVSGDKELARAYTAAAEVLDPEIPVVTLADLGILRGVTRRGDAIVVTLTPTYTGCPATAAIKMDVENALLAAGLDSVRVETVLSPPWTTDDITDAGRRKLLAYGIAPPGAATPDGLFADERIVCPQCRSNDTTKISEFGSTACKALWRCNACREPFDYFKCH